MFFKHLLIAILLTAPIYSANADDGGYRIEVKVEGLQDTLCYLAYHFGERQFLKDTARVNEHGQFVFEGTEAANPGMYMIVLPGNIYFEVIVDQNQHFSVSTSKENLIQDLSFTNSPDNIAFYQYISKLQESNKMMAELRKQLENKDLAGEEREKVNSRLKELEEKIIQIQDQHIANDPDGLFSYLILAQRNPDISDISDDTTNSHDTRDAEYYLYKKRFWDHIDFSDDRILRTPVYHSMLNRYFNNFLLQIPDTIIAAADLLLETCHDNQEFFRYTLWFITNNAERSQVMGMDAVFVHLVENYYNTGQAYWMNQEGLDRLKNKATQLSPILIGKIAPEIEAITLENSTKSIYDIDAEFLVIYFWESECGHCKKETPILKNIYEKYQEKGLEVFALNVEADQEKWKEAVKQYDLQWINASDATNYSGFRDNYDVYAIPMIFLLDKGKKIIAKRISADQLDGFLQFYLNNQADQTP